MNLNSTKPVEAFDEDIAVMSGKIRAFKSLPDGIIRMMIEVDPEYQDTALCWFSELESRIAVARLKLDDTQKEVI